MRARRLATATLAALTALPGAAAATASPGGPPPLRVSVGDTTFTVRASAYIWKGVSADSVPIGQARPARSTPVARGQKVTARVNYTATKMAVAEVVPGMRAGTTLGRTTGKKSIVWSPRLRTGRANVEVFVNTADGFASYVFSLRRA